MYLNSLDLKTVFSVYNLWENRRQVEGWHGFSIESHFPLKRLVLYANPKAAIEPVQRIAKLLQGSLPVDVLPLPRFRYCGSIAPSPAPPQLGAGVFAINHACGRGPNGSIGGFLKYVDKKEDEPFLLLSASHVLGRKPTCRTNDFEIDLDRGATTISKVVHAVDIQTSGTNLVDAAVAEISISAVQNLFQGNVLDLSKIPGPRPTKDALVDKLGSKTDLTHGRVVQPSQTIEILPSAEIGSASFEDQMLVVSTDDTKPFVQDGDSGGLVVSNGVPVGIVIAKSEQEDIPGQPASEAAQIEGRYALISPIDAVLNQLASKLNRAVEFVPNSTLAHPVMAAIIAPGQKPQGNGPAAIV
jgi:hypothetical protein